MRSGGPPPLVQLETVTKHVGEIVRLGRPEVPPWVTATDLTFGQLRLLFRLRHEGPTSMTQLAHLLGASTPTTTGVVERVERHGLVAREHRDDDRRVVDCRLTEAGAALAVEVDGLRVDAMRRVLALLDEKELADLDRLLTLIIDRSRENRAS
jgi:DNA-binding MarR family transcriptional regulator